VSAGVIFPGERLNFIRRQASSEMRHPATDEISQKIELIAKGQARKMESVGRLIRKLHKAYQLVGLFHKIRFTNVSLEATRTCAAGDAFPLVWLAKGSLDSWLL
jgi:hypothetical protein